jgi:hypothetical protein
MSVGGASRLSRRTVLAGLGVALPGVLAGSSAGTPERAGGLALVRRIER